MQLVNFSVTNYRSITKAHKINLQNITVLVGRNNEGKSNILMALNVAMETMMQHANHANVHERLYDWQRDFPVQLQQRKNNLDSIFRLNFRLNHDENTEFFRTTGIRSNEDIPIELKYGQDNRAKITVPKKGSSSFNDKSEKVTAFICERIAINYIQAVRTEDMAMDVIHRLISTELSKLYDNEEYKSAEQTIYNLQEAVYNDIANRILAPLQEFLPQLTNVEIKSRGRRLVWRGFRNDVDVILNDGTPTSILYKGDGIKSLVSLAILKESKNEIGASIIAIEEPESHLHPEAIHSLVNVINGISENHQVIITTHNPLFVQRNNISNNIIVDHGTAKPAKNIKEIRELLGVLPEDNLINASHVLVVEGEDDKIALNKILSSLSPTIKDALIKNKLVIQPLAGATNLNYELSRLRSYVCRYFVFLDADEAGYDAAEKAIEKGLLSESDVKYSICNGNNTAEFEDCLKKDFYIEAIRNKFSVDLGVTSFRNSKKWSDRVSLFDPFPPEMGTDTAFLDRFHAYIPGWEIPKYRPDSFTNDYGFITDYLSEFMRELRKDNYSNIAEKYFKLGNNLNQRDAIAVRKLISGFIKLIYPDGEVSKEEVAEIMDISLELRRRVKEQLKKIGGMEFYDVNFSYIDNDSFDEHFVSVPEQGGGKMIPEGMGKPGCLYTVSKSKTGMIGCYRLETQMMPGNGKLTCTGIGSGKEPKEATNTAFNYLKANGNAISGNISTTTKDYIINYQDMQGLGMTGNLALPTLIAISSAALSKPPISSLAVLGEISIGGTLIKVEDLASTLQVCLDSGAKKVLLPITSAADLGTVPSDLVGAFSLIFYSSPEEAVYKALGVE